MAAALADIGLIRTWRKADPNLTISEFMPFFLHFLHSTAYIQTYINDGGEKRMIWLQMHRFAFLFNAQTYVWCYLIIEAGSLFSGNFLRNTCLRRNQSLISYGKRVYIMQALPPSHAERLFSFLSDLLGVLKHQRRSLFPAATLWRLQEKSLWAVLCRRMTHVVVVIVSKCIRLVFVGWNCPVDSKTDLNRSDSLLLGRIPEAFWTFPSTSTATLAILRNKCSASCDWLSNVRE